MTHVGQELKHNSWISSRRVIFPIVSPTGLVGLIFLATCLSACRLPRGGTSDPEMDRARTYLESSGMTVSELKRLPDGTFSLTAADVTGPDLFALRAIPVTQLDLAMMPITNLAGLAGTGLRVLYLEYTAATNLAPLRGMRLRKLSLTGVPVSDLSPLAGMPLEELGLGLTAVTDLSPLKGMPLKELALHATGVSDLGPLEGMPLRGITLTGTRVTDLLPLLGAPLRSISISAEQIKKGAEVLESVDRKAVISEPGAPEAVSATQATIFPPRSVQDVKLVLHKAGLAYRLLVADAEGRYELVLGRSDVSDISALHGLPIKSLDLGDTDVSDLSALKGMSLQRLYAWDTKVRDLSPLRGMPITRLNVGGTRVASLSALSGMPLVGLEVYGTRVADLSPLKGMPLERLDMRWTRVRDVRILAKLPLRELRFNPDKVRKGIDGLKKSSTLETINEKPADKFWEEMAAAATP
jgi:Leucine-rich repeat (LRR) protein